MTAAPREAVLLSLPGAFGQWLLARTARGVEASGLRLSVVRIDRFDTVEPADDCDIRLLVAHHPSAALLAYAQERRLPAVLALSPAAAAVTDLCAQQGCDALQAIRICSASSALLVGWLPTPNLRRIAAETGYEPARDVLAAVADHFGLEHEALCAAMEGGPSIDEAILAELGVDRRADADRLNDRELWHVEVALAPLVGRLHGAPQETMSWPHDVLLSGDALDTPARAVVDITGPARTLYYGPYFHLPSGGWRLDAVLGFSDDITDMSFLIEVHGGGLLAHGRVKPMAGGLFRAQMAFVVHDAAHPIEIRLRNEAGAIEGRIALAQLDLHPLATVS